MAQFKLENNKITVTASHNVTGEELNFPILEVTKDTEGTKVIPVNITKASPSFMLSLHMSLFQQFQENQLEQSLMDLMSKIYRKNENED